MQLILSWKMIKKLLAYGSVAAVILGGAFWCLLAFSGWGADMRQKGNMYVDMNYEQNWGIQKKALGYLRIALDLFPVNTNISFDKDAGDFGAKTVHSLLSDWNNKVLNSVYVSNEQALLAAISSAKAGDLIVIEPGIYSIKRRNIPVRNNGTQAHPIILAASRLGDVKLRFDGLEGLLITGKYWVIKNIHFIGACEHESNCEHAMHLYGDADHTVIDNNIFNNFNAPIKSNGNYTKELARYPDNVLISRNDFFNSSPRKIYLPTTAIDVVGGDNWLLKGNFIADFTRIQRNRPSPTYMAFLKGGGKNSIIEDNMIMCSWMVPHQNSLDIRVGLSLGNGGTGAQFCADKECAYEHTGGVIRRNIIMNCQTDVGIYLNKSANTKIENNVVLNTLGIDARFAETSSVMSGNLLHGRIKSRNGGFISENNNRTLSHWRSPSQLDIIETLNQ